jgi:hypothetical protein
MASKKPETVLAWAWEIEIDGEWKLYSWAEPSMRQLLSNDRPPSPEARVVCVRMIREAEIAALHRRIAELEAR